MSQGDYDQTRDMTEMEREFIGTHKEFFAKLKRREGSGSVEFIPASPETLPQPRDVKS